jgi:hypothetical protein
MVGTEGIEPNCHHPTYYGNGFTVRRREQHPFDMLIALFAMLMRNSLELPQLYT